MKLGLPRPPLSRSEEKKKLAYVEAGRAVLITALAPSLPNVLQVNSPKQNLTLSGRPRESKRIVMA